MPGEHNTTAWRSLDVKSDTLWFGGILSICLLLMSIGVAGAYPRSKATAFPELPDKFRTTDSYFFDTSYERPGEQPVLLYTAWGASMAGYLEKVGYSQDEIYRIDLWLFQGWGSQHPKHYVKTLEDYIMQMREDHPGKKVDIIAHSLGGLTARWYIEMQDGAQYVDDLVTIATPNQGGYVFWAFYWTPAGRAMVPNSRMLKQLNSKPLADSVEYTAVWSSIDEVFLFNLFGSKGPKLPEKLIEEHGNARNVFGGYSEHIELAISWSAFKQYMKYLD
jgi:triacylglycerol lipase